VAALVNFHARQKLILMSHCPQTYRELGPLVAGTTRATLAEVAPVYLRALMAALRRRATRGRHANVLQHVQGYLKSISDPTTRPR
jgi:uncharacterized protein YbgA (DUF1722 family)